MALDRDAGRELADERAFGALVAMGFMDPEGDAMITVGMAAAIVCSGVIILHLVTAESPLKQVLSSRVLVYLGLISYGLYLWHLPVYKLFYYQLDGLPWGVVAFLAIGSSLLLASLSYRFVEQPFLRKRHGGESAVAQGQMSTDTLAAPM